jgi:hypothetical protein
METPDRGVTFSQFEFALRVEAGIDDLESPFDPVLGRNDHGLHNLLVSPQTGAVTAILDWGYTLAVPAAFDIEFAVYILSGAFLAGRPDVPNWRSVDEALSVAVVPSVGASDSTEGVVSAFGFRVEQPASPKKAPVERPRRARRFM